MYMNNWCDRVRIKHYEMRGVRGEPYIVNREIFEETYEDAFDAAPASGACEHEKLL